MTRTDTGLSPEEMWTRSTAMNVADVLANCHVLGCPVFVLEPKLRKSGVKIPRWDPRSRQGVNIGFSRLHCSLIALVLNTTTNKTITTHLHVVFDDALTTVPHNCEINLQAYQDLIMTSQLREDTIENVHLTVPLDPADSSELGMMLTLALSMTLNVVVVWLLLISFPDLHQFPLLPLALLPLNSRGRHLQFEMNLQLNRPQGR
jgi:hypothetical protein